MKESKRAKVLLVLGNIILWSGIIIQWNYNLVLGSVLILLSLPIGFLYLRTR